MRGKPPVNCKALVDLLCAVSRFGAAAGARLEELDLNPVLAGADGAVAVDCVWCCRLPPDRVFLLLIHHRPGGGKQQLLLSRCGG